MSTAPSVHHGLSENVPAAVPVRERYVLAPLFLLAAGLVLRGLYLFHAPFDTDEAQHLHVAWGWSQGLVQYRDVFDNHAPLFHLLASILVRAVGEKPQLLFWGRAAMLPLYLLALWLTFRIGAELFDRRTGLWSAAITGLLPPFFNSSLEFRPDNMWAVLWLATVLAALRAGERRSRWLLSGLLLGVTVMTSVKTALLLLTFGLPLVVLTAAGGINRRWLFCAAALAAGTLIVPLITVAAFGAMGALPQMGYCLVVHNQVPGAYRGVHKLIRAGLFLPACLAIGLILWRIDGGKGASGKNRQRLAVAFGAASAYIGFATIFPITDRQDYLPVHPLLVVSLVPLVLGAVGPWLPRLRLTAPLALTAFAGAELIVLLVAAPWQDETVGPLQRVANTLRLTAPGDFVMDVKGEMLFRRRAFYYALEQVTRERIRRGILRDDTPEQLVATGTRVVTVANRWFPPRAQAFMNAHYVAVYDPKLPEPTGWAGGMVRVPGQILPAGRDSWVEVVIGCEYVLVGEDGSTGGTIDGRPAGPGVYLAPGRHLVRPEAGATNAALIWSKAIDNGFRPLLRPKSDSRRGHSPSRS